MFDIAIFTALGWERRAVLAGLEEVRVRERDRIWSGRSGDLSCLVVQTGVGQVRAAAAARTVDAGAFVACGCAGALAADLRPGDVVVADGVLLIDPAGRIERRVSATPLGIAGWAAARGIALRAGPVASSPSVLASVATKRTVAASGALVVEMESAAIAAIAEARGVPFTGVRVVLDVADQELPLAVDVLDPVTGELRPARAVVVLAPRPWLWPPVARLAWQTRIADRRLRAFVADALRDGALAARSTERTPPAAAH
jgi:nucleoside phosphorylase